MKNSYYFLTFLCSLLAFQISQADSGEPEDDSDYSVVDDSTYQYRKSDFDGGRLRNQLIYFPENIKSGGRSPLVVISHGNGHEYTYYTYLQKYLADKGYIVMSHENNTRPGIKTSAETTLKNTDLFLGSLDKIAGGALVGRVDKHKIAWIGHSRGGEGVVHAYDQLVDGTFVPENYSVDDIQFVSSIAPTTFLAAEDVDPHKVNYHMFVGGADGDVNGRPQRVVMSMPIYERGVGEKSLTYVQGAGHNVFNDQNWDEGDGPKRLERKQVHKIATEVYGALLETYLLGSTRWKKHLQANWEVLRLPGIPQEYAISNEFKLAMDSEDRWVVDDFQAAKAKDVASSKATVEFDVKNIYEGILQDGNGSFAFVEGDPMNGMTRYLDQTEPPKGVVFEWEGSDAALSYILPEAWDLSAFEALSLRAAQVSHHPLTKLLDAPLGFSVRLVDAQGEQSLLASDVFGAVNPPYPRFGGWANEFCVFHMPLADFLQENPSMDMANIVKVEFLFGQNFGSEQGRLALDDIEFVKSFF